MFLVCTSVRSINKVFISLHKDGKGTKSSVYLGRGVCVVCTSVRSINCGFWILQKGGKGHIIFGLFGA